MYTPSDASYLSAKNARSRAGGFYFLGSVPEEGKPIFLNGAIHVLCQILKLVTASAAEAELGALFLNAQEAKIMRITLEELGHKQSPIPISIDNTTTVGIVNNTIKRQKSRSMEMRYFWLLDQEAQKMLTPQDRKILEIFLPRITLGTYINIADHITSICQTHHGIYRGP